MKVMIIQVQEEGDGDSPVGAIPRTLDSVPGRSATVVLVRVVCALPLLPPKSSSSSSLLRLSCS
jgi:hypothetical protein